MHVLQVYGGPVFGTLGGHEYVVRKLSEESSKRSLKTKVLCPSLNKGVICHKAKQIEYIEIPSYRLSNRVWFPKLSFLPLIMLNLKNTDLVHAHCPDNPFVFFLALISKFLNRPLITTILAYADDFKHHEKIMRILGLFTAVQQTIAIWISDKVHVESLYDAYKLHMYKRKVVMIPPGVDDDILAGKPSKRTLKIMKNKIRPQKGEKIILYLGRIHKAKGVNHAVSALAMLKKAGNRVKLVVAGPHNNFLKETERSANDLGLSNEFIYVGKVTDKEKIALLDLADVVVVPSLSDIVEAYSIVASEAWARRKLVVAYAVGALRYRVKSGINGYLARAKDTKELATEIAASFSCSRNFEIPPDVWSWNKVANQFKHTYTDLLRKWQKYQGQKW